MDVATLRQAYHQRICQEIIRIDRCGNIECLNLADVRNRTSIRIAWGIAKAIGYSRNEKPVQEQTVNRCFATITQDFIAQTSVLLKHLRPGEWVYFLDVSVLSFDQYEHLVDVEDFITRDSLLMSSLGPIYIPQPDISIGRHPLLDEVINKSCQVLEPSLPFASLTPLRAANFDNPLPILHACIFCEWSLHGNEAENARTEALNLIRNRKGSLPHIVAVTAEPLPTRLAALALGTGDLDCVYHFALPELQQALQEACNEDQLDILNTLVTGRRLRDISDLPFDLAV